MSAHGIRHETWEAIPRETVTNDIGRRLFTGERMMLAQVYLDEGAVVPWHSHENEQLTWILSGSSTSATRDRTTWRRSWYRPGRSSTSLPMCPTGRRP